MKKGAEKQRGHQKHGCDDRETFRKIMTKRIHAGRRWYERETEMRYQTSNGRKLRILREKKTPAETERGTERE